jgi:hypothetical protein
MGNVACNYVLAGRYMRGSFVIKKNEPVLTSVRTLKMLKPAMILFRNCKCRIKIGRNNVLCCEIFTIHAALTLFFRAQEHTAVIRTCYNFIINRTFYRSRQGNVAWLWRNGALYRRPTVWRHEVRYGSVRPWTNLPPKKHFHVKTALTRKCPSTINMEFKPRAKWRNVQGYREGYTRKERKCKFWTVNDRRIKNVARQICERGDYLVI